MDITPDLEKLAQEAYHAYGGVTDWKNYQGLPMPKWEDLTPKIREAWCAATARVAAIVSTAEKGHFCSEACG